MPVPPTKAPVDRNTFLDTLWATDLLSASQFTRAEALAPAGSATDAARALVEAELLTRFQAERLLAGRTDGFFIDQYVLLEKVGRGSVSRVFKAKHRTMNRPVALKVLSSGLTRTAEERQTFQAEVRAAAKLAHPNIVTAYDINELCDRFYLVLEFVDGPNLDDLVRHSGPLPVAEACEFVRQTASGLQHAHEKGMIHRDIKPTNLLVARPTPAAPLAIKIADFGIPKTLSTAGPSDSAAPEARGTGPGLVDGRADLYSLGCVFYFLLTGRPPGAVPVPVGQLRPDVAPEVAVIVHRLLAPSPAMRFTSAAELLLHLDAACVPVAIPMDEVNFDFPYPGHPGHDSGFYFGGNPPPGSGPHTPLGSGAFAVPTPAPEPSPWAQITEAVAEETKPFDLDVTPAPPPHKTKPKPKQTGHGEPVPLWRTITLLVSTVLLCVLCLVMIVKPVK
jgi:serine/threonine-protein kinase